MYHEGTDLSVSVTSSSPSEQMICPSFTLKADALAPYCAITTTQTTLLRSLNWHVSAQGSKYAIRYSYLGSSHYACGKWGWTTQPSVLSLSCCRHSDSQCGLVTQWLHTLIQPYQNCVVNENFKVTFHAFIVLISCRLTQGRMRIVLRSSKLWILFSCFNTSSVSADRQAGAKGLK